MPEANSPARALLLFGPPGSGKGSQAKLIEECLSIAHISTGDMLRERMQVEDELGVEIRSRVDRGELVTDELANRLVAERIAAADCAKGFILDGYPRTLSQAATICGELAARKIGWLVIHLQVDYNVIIRRLAGRRHCVRCGAVYNVASCPPQQTNVCDACGAGLAIREDDTERVVRRRLDAYDAQTRPLLEFFAADGAPLLAVDGAGAPPAVIARQICEFARLAFAAGAPVARGSRA